VSKNSSSNNDALDRYFSAEDTLYNTERKLKNCMNEINRLISELELEDAKLVALEKAYKGAGGVSVEEWNNKILELKNEERIREEKNNWLKTAANEILPYIIVKQELEELLEQMYFEKETERMLVIKESVVSVLPQIYKRIQAKRDDFSDSLRDELLRELSEAWNIGNDSATIILNLSKTEFSQLLGVITKLLDYDKQQIIDVRNCVKESIIKSQKIREEIDNVNVEGIDSYLIEKDSILDRTRTLLREKEMLILSQKELQEEVEAAKGLYKRAEKELDKQLKSASVSSLTARAIVCLETLQKRLFESEIQKVQELFMIKMRQLMRKEHFIDKIIIDDEFHVRVYKKVKLDCNRVCSTINKISVEKYIDEFGLIHCNDILRISGCDTLMEFVQKYKNSNKIFDTMLEFDKATMSKGEKQVFIMALYWAIVQLSNKEIPFIIDTPFARIDTEHREHITEHFFKTLRGQVFIFSTDEEITTRHMAVIGEKLAAKFLIENVDNTKTIIKPNKYFGD